MTRQSRERNSADEWLRLHSAVSKTTRHELKPLGISQKSRSRNNSKSRGAGLNFGYHYTWQKELGNRLDELVDSFLDFDPALPAEFREQQFARHLLWILNDYRSYFVRLFVRDIRPYDLDCLWVRLLPYITGEFPEDLQLYDARLMSFSSAMHELLRSIIKEHDNDFASQMLQIRRIMAMMRGRRGV